MKQKIKVKIDGEEHEAESRTFSTGNKGYGLYRKIIIDNETYQVSLNVVKIEKKK